MSSSFPKNKIALPTVGRIVHVFVTNTEPVHPMSAVVASVPDDGRPLTIHACVFWPNGNPSGMRDVPHKSQAAEHGEMFWDWMDYQKGQAAKTEALQAELEERNRPKTAEEVQAAAVARTAAMLADPRNAP